MTFRTQFFTFHSQIDAFVVKISYNISEFVNSRSSFYETSNHPFFKQV